MPKPKKLPLIISPEMTVKYSHLVKPNTKFNADGVFSVTGILDPNDPNVKKFLAQLGQLADDARLEKEQTNKKINDKWKTFVGYRNEENEDGAETGMIRIDFKNNAVGKGKDGKTFKVTIPIVDSKKKPMINPKIGNGSTVKVAFEAVPFAQDSNKNVGVSMRLKAVQVITYIPYSNSAASAFGEEQGFEAEAGGEDQFDDESSSTTEEKPAGNKGNGDF